MKNKNTRVKYAHRKSESQESTSLLLVCDYLQRRPAEVGSPCSSPPHPAGRPPHSLCYPAATVAGRGEGGREGGRGGKQTSRESREEENKQGRDGVLHSGLARGKASTKPPHLETDRALDAKHTPIYTPSLAPVSWACC